MTTVVANQKTFEIMAQFFPDMTIRNTLVVNEGDTLPLGTHTLNFVFAPMVHWPEVMVTYESTEKVLFAADGFGKFGALDREEPWADEARRYYIGIVGKYGDFVQDLLKKASGLEIRTICPLHGPVLKENLGYYLDLYDKWSGYKPEDKGVVIAYTSVYGHTKQAVLMLRDDLRSRGVPNVEVYDLARDDMAKAVDAAFRYDKLVLATTTYNAEIYPFMHYFLINLRELHLHDPSAGKLSFPCIVTACEKYNQITAFILFFLQRIEERSEDSDILRHKISVFMSDYLRLGGRCRFGSRC